MESGRVLEVGCGRGAGLPLLLTGFGAAHVDGVMLTQNRFHVLRDAWEGSTRDVSVCTWLLLSGYPFLMRASMPCSTSASFTTCLPGRGL